MNIFQKKSLWIISCALLIVCFSMIGCEDEESSTSPTGGETYPYDPGPGNLAGRVLGTTSDRALSGVNVAVGGIAATTDADGVFQLNGVGQGAMSVSISGENVYRRTARINTADGRYVILDAIETNSAFDLTFYREIARGNHPAEGDMTPTHRWTNPAPPTFYIVTNASSTLDGNIDQETIDTVTNVLQEIIPAFTGNVYASITVKPMYFAKLETFDDVPDNAFLVVFDDTLAEQGAYGVTATDPDFISPSTSFINKAVIFLLDNAQYYENPSNPSLISFEEIIAHEVGHGMGFRHTSGPPTGPPSVMVKTGKFGDMYSSTDLFHMAIVYKRPAGNTDIDNDPGSNAKMVASFPGRQVFVDDRLNVPLSSEHRQKVQSLQRFGLLERLLNERY